MNSSRIISIIFRLFTAMLLFSALDSHPYGFYTFLRIVTCIAALHVLYLAIEDNKEKWAWGFGFIALLFNPIIPFHLGKDIWQFLDIVVAILFLVSIFTVKAKNQRIDIKEKS